MEFSGEFKKLFDLVEHTSANVFLTGKAGTGKTTFLKYLRENSAKRIAVAAPTGVAAINAGGVTLHSLFQLPFEPFLPNTRRSDNLYRFSKQKQGLIRSLDLLVIDEISMVRADLLDAVDDALRRVRRNGNPFGGLQLLLIGDMQQLPPVLPQQEEMLLREVYPSPYFFYSLALAKTGYSCVELTKIYRQSESSFVELLNAVRTNALSAAQLDQLNSHYAPGFNPHENEGYIRLTTHNAKARDVNVQKLADLPSPSVFFKATVTDVFPESSFPTDETLELKVGAQVMFVKNDPSPNKAFFNGKIGVISSISDEGIEVRFPDGSFVMAPKLKWDNVQLEMDEAKELKEKVIGSFEQYPLRLAWSITVHKSQGLTFDKVILDVNSAFAHGQVYVALSRCRSLDGLVLNSRLTPAAILNDSQILNFTNSAKEKFVSDTQLEQMKNAYFETLAFDLFDFSAINNTLISLERLIVEYLPSAYSNLAHEIKKQQPVFCSEVYEVAQKFKNQLLNLARTDREQMQVRITKASNYFIGKIHTLVLPLQDKLKVEVSRKDVKNRYLGLLEDLKLNVDVKLFTLRAAIEGFSIESYLHEKAMALAGDDVVEKKRLNRRKTEARQAKDSQPKEPKIPTAQLSFTLYRQGKTPQQVADERQLSLTTILSHLAVYVQNGELDLLELVPQDHVYAIEAYIYAHPDVKSLKEIHEALGKKYEYGEIRLVLSQSKFNQ